MFRHLPRFSLLAKSFPDKNQISTKALLDGVGGQVRESLQNDVNTCAIRISVAFNGTSEKIRRSPGVYLLAGKKPGHHGPKVVAANRYLVRARDIHTYLQANYGPGNSSMTR